MHPNSRALQQHSPESALLGTSDVKIGSGKNLRHCRLNMIDSHSAFSIRDTFRYTDLPDLVRRLAEIPAPAPDTLPADLRVCRALQTRMQRVQAVLLDMDGVLYRGDELLEGVLAFLNFVKGAGRHILYVTNNATRTPAMFVDKLQAMGIEASEDQILTSAEATGGWMARHLPAGSKVQLIGEAGVWSAMITRGFRPANKPQDADCVVVGMDFHLDYRKCAQATLAIKAGATFIGTNEDPTFPSEEGEIPGAGSIVALLRTATGQEPIVIGKPYPGMFEEAMARLGLAADECLMVGDRYETDIQGAQDLDMWTVGIGTGVTAYEEFWTKDRVPNFVLRDMEEFLHVFRDLGLFGSTPA